MKHVLILLTALALTLASCKDYLAVTPDKSLTVPTTIADLQALLENSYMFSSGPSGTILGADNYYLEYTTWQSWNLVPRNSYIWAQDVYEGTASSLLDWGALYEIIYTCNVVLDGLKSIPVAPINRLSYNSTKGMALFYRAFAFFGLAQEYALPYSEATAATDTGIPLRLTPDLEKKIHRVSVKSTYQQIISDLRNCIRLLPNTVQINHMNRPSKPAAYALLARIFLSMRDYKNAGLYADSSLQLHDNLLDYNTVNLADRFPFPKDNPELLLQCYINTHTSVIKTYKTTKLADTVLYRSYKNHDLRKALFFAKNDYNRPYYHASYTGNTALFNGLATDEMYLIRAECEVRSGKVDLALKDLNTLLKTRWKSGMFAFYTEHDVDKLLNIILLERRKELVFRGLRWSDLRRLNQEPEHSRILKRSLDGTIYTLPPRDPRYVYPIPEDEIKLSGIAQNRR